MKPSTKYSPEVRKQAMRLFLDHQGEHDSQWSGIVYDRPMIGVGCQHTAGAGCPSPALMACRVTFAQQQLALRADEV